MNTPTAMLNFTHKHTAHCETGVTAILLANKGQNVSEAMVFGIGSGIFFAYLPMFKVGSLPLTSYRMPPGFIFRQATKFLGITVEEQRFKSRQQGMDVLDKCLDEGIPVGCQTGVYWLDYFPDSMRFHFNAHNIIVYDKEGDDYLVSDPVIEMQVRCPRKSLELARFAEGPLAPKGRLYYLKSVPEELDLKKAAIKGIKRTCWIMRPPLGPIGARGPQYLAWAMERWPKRYTPVHASRLLGNVIRMQEEIGTGGGGFRFMYASFLQECAGLFDNGRLSELANDMTGIGDSWREFAAKAARQCKGRGEPGGESVYRDLAAMLRDCAKRERVLFSQLASVSKQLT